MKNNLKRIACLLSASLLCAGALCLSSCKTNKGDDIVKSFDSSAALASACGIEEVSFVPEGYEAKAFRTYYSVVSETEYRPTEQESAGNADEDADKTEKVVIFRVVDAGYGVDNLSGYTETSLSEQYVTEDYEENKFFPIEARDEILATEWTAYYSGKLCNMSLSMVGGNVNEFKSVIDQLIVYLGGEK